jgi:hypothetical protein
MSTWFQRWLFSSFGFRKAASAFAETFSAMPLSSSCEVISVSTVKLGAKCGRGQRHRLAVSVLQSTDCMAYMRTAVSGYFHLVHCS